MHCDKNDEAVKKLHLPGHLLPMNRDLLIDYLIMKRRRKLLRRWACSNNSIHIKFLNALMGTFLFETLSHYY